MPTDAETIATLETKIATLQEMCETLQHKLEQQQQETINVLEESWWLHTLFQRASTGLITATLDGHLTRYNPAFQHMIGYSRSEMIGLSFDTFTHPDDLQTEIPLVQEMLAGNQSTVTLEKRFIRKNGTTLWVNVQLSVGYDSENNPQALIGIVEDITQQRQTVQSLHDSEEQYRTIIEHMRDGVFLIANARLIFANQSFAHMLGYTQEEIVQLDFADVIAPEDLPMVADRNKRRADGEDVPDQYEFCMLHRDGRRVVVNIVVNSLYYKGRTVIMGTTRDITHQKQLEQERIHLQQQVIDAQQTAIRELSTPLIPLTHHTVLMPLVGSIDSNRAQMIMETLLEGIATHQAEQAIVDITGVSVVDTQVAHALVQAASAAQLLGAKVLLTGIGPTMAQTLIHLGVDLGSFQTRGSLQRAVMDTLSQNLQNNRNF